MKSNIGCLIETFALERGIDLQPCGGWTLRNAPKAAGLEPDESYVLGTRPYPERPDLAIEVIWTHGGIDKLEIYRRLGVPEVWFWRDDALVVYVLRVDRYEESLSSTQLPGLDITLLTSFLDHVPVTQASPRGPRSADAAPRQPHECVPRVDPRVALAGRSW